LRREVSDGLRGSREAVIALVILGIVGGALGAYLLTKTDPKLFSKIVPYLILMSVAIFLGQEPLSRRLKARAQETASESDTPDILRLNLPVGVFLFLVAVYGGYFGAGIGILTLAALGLVGMRDIHRMNGVKAVFRLGINGVAAMLFVVQGLVDWRMTGLMAIASLFGGYSGAGIARRLGQQNVRRIVVAIGLLLAAKMLFMH